MVEELPAPRTAYEGHERSTPWNDLQYLYFIGYAFWNYFTTPFLLASEGVVCEEVEPWEENHQKWRVSILQSTLTARCKNSTSTTMACCSVTTTSPTSPKVTRPITAWTIRPLPACFPHASTRGFAWGR